MTTEYGTQKGNRKGPTAEMRSVPVFYFLFPGIVIYYFSYRKDNTVYGGGQSLSGFIFPGGDDLLASSVYVEGGDDNEYNTYRAL